MSGFFPALLFFHPAAQIGWDQFTVHWSTVAGLAAFWGLYEWRARVHWRAAQSPEELAGPTPAQRALFVGGILLMFLSLNGPLHDLSDYYLFSAHMVQHLILTLLVAPLFVLGTPGWMLRPALRVRWVRTAAHAVTGPRTAFMIFNVVVAAWHLPPLYNTAMAFHDVHIVQHLMFLIAAVIMWWPVTSPLPELPRLSYPGQMLYLFLMSIPMSIIAIYVAMADRVLYPAYSAAPRIWGISPLVDQQIGGLIMWVPGGLYFFLVMSIVFYRWSESGQDSAAGAQVGWKAG